MEGHCVLLKRVRIGGKEQPKWLSLRYSKEDTKLGPEAAQVFTKHLSPSPLWEPWILLPEAVGVGCFPYCTSSEQK